MLTLLLALQAQAADAPSLYTRQMVGGGGWPSGLIGDTRIQARTPLYRSDSIVFQDTYAGLGARLAASPAFIEAGPRLSIAPIDVFDVEVQATWHRFFGNSYGMLPMADNTGTLSDERDARADETFGTSAFSLTVVPTVKLKVGPIVAFDSVTIQSFALKDPPTLEQGLVYHPFWDLVIAPSDVIFEHQAAALYAILPGDDGPLLWVGPTFRDRWAGSSGDRSTVLGAFLRVRPGPAEARAVPNIVFMAMPYLKDADQRAAPAIQAAAIWSTDSPLKR